MSQRHNSICLEKFIYILKYEYMLVICKIRRHFDLDLQLVPLDGIITKIVF